MFELGKNFSAFITNKHSQIVSEEDFYYFDLIMQRISEAHTTNVVCMSFGEHPWKSAFAHANALERDLLLVFLFIQNCILVQFENVFFCF